MHDFDIILGMDWLATHYASIDCHRKKVNFRIPNQHEFEFIGKPNHVHPRVISAIQAKLMLAYGYKGYLAMVKNIRR